MRLQVSRHVVRFLVNERTRLAYSISILAVDHLRQEVLHDLPQGLVILFESLFLRVTSSNAKRSVFPLPLSLFIQLGIFISILSPSRSLTRPHSDYMKTLKKALQEEGKSEDEIKAFEKGAAGLAKKILGNFKVRSMLVLCGSCRSLLISF